MADTLQVIPDYTDANVLADISPLLSMVMARSPQLNWLMINGSVRGDETRLFDWPEIAREETTGTLAVTYVSASGTIVMTAGDGVKFKDDDIIYIEGHKDADNLQVKFRVDSIAVETITATRVAGSATGLAVTVPGQTIHRQNPVRDNAGAGTEKTDEHVLVNNFLQLFQRDIEIGAKAQQLSKAGGVPGLNDLFAHGLSHKIHEIVREIENAIWFGNGQPETAALGAAMKGIEQFVNTAADDNRVDAGSASLTEGMINDLIQQLYQRGLTQSDQLVLIASPANARAISAFARDTIRLERTDSQRGNQVQTFIPELQGTQTVEIIWDHKQQDSQVWLLARNQIDIVGAEPAPEVKDAMTMPAIPTEMNASNLQGFGWVVDSTPPGQHGRIFTVRAELSIRVRQALRVHGTIHSITP